MLASEFARCGVRFASDGFQLEFRVGGLPLAGLRLRPALARV